MEYISTQPSQFASQWSRTFELKAIRRVRASIFTSVTSCISTGGASEFHTYIQFRVS